MVFNSIEFLIFFPIVLLWHFLSPKKYRWIGLLVASYYFYMSWNPELVFLILFTTGISYLSSIIIEKTDNRRVKRIFLILTLVVCFGVLFFFKYFNFLSHSVTGIMRMFGSSASDFTLNLILPVGISFYTFQTLSYVIDVYRGNVKAERHFGYYALYVSFFPQLVAGPIERPENLIPQLYAENKFDFGKASSGFKKMITGFFKKVVIADLAAQYVNAVYNDVSSADGFSIVIATLLFAIQIYCDFSGYTDIAIGCAEIMGIKLMQNFDRPYIATSIKEFWARWHISLSTWFRDYLYIPLGGNRCSLARHMFNIFVVFLVSGLWHGADWTFVIWGALHGLYQIIGYLTLKPKQKLFDKLHINTKAKWFMTIKRINTFLLVCFAWIFFRANNVSDLGILLNKLFCDWNFDLAGLMTSFTASGLTLLSAVTLLLAVVVMRFMDKRTNSASLETGECGIDCVRSVDYAYFIWVIAAAWLLLLAGNGASAFIYFQF